jgi:SAM-dependent methyltransferase
MKHTININKEKFSASNQGKRDCKDFMIFDEFAVGLGLEIGCGTNRFSDTVLAIDRSPLSHADMICDASVLPFNDRTFDFIFSSHCLKDFEKPLEVLKEWLRVIKPMGYLLILLPNMEEAVNWENKAKFKSTIPVMMGMITKCPAKLVEYFYLETSTSFGIIMQRLPCKRDEYKLVYTPFGRALLFSEQKDIVACIYEDKSIKVFDKSEVKIDHNYRYPDLLSLIEEA